MARRPGRISRYASGTGRTSAVADAIDAFIARTGADELILTSNMYDHAARLRSIEIVAGMIEATADA